RPHRISCRRAFNSSPSFRTRLRILRRSDQMRIDHQGEYGGGEMNELTREERAAQNRPSGIAWDAFKDFKATLTAGFQLCHGAGCGHDDCEVGEYLRMKHKEEREARLEGYGREFDRAVGNVPTKDDIAKLKSDYIDLRAAVDAANQDYSERRESYQERIDAIEREFTEANAELIETR